MKTVMTATCPMCLMSVRFLMSDVSAKGEFPVCSCGAIIAIVPQEFSFSGAKRVAEMLEKTGANHSDLKGVELFWSGWESSPEKIDQFWAIFAKKP